jgi:hypothetical protein
MLSPCFSPTRRNLSCEAAAEHSAKKKQGEAENNHKGTVGNHHAEHVLHALAIDRFLQRG